MADYMDYSVDIKGSFYGDDNTILGKRWWYTNDNIIVKIIFILLPLNPSHWTFKTVNITAKHQHVIIYLSSAVSQSC